MTDEANIYPEVGADFAGHDAVNHSEKEYVRYWNEVTDKVRPDGKPIVATTTITTNNAMRLAVFRPRVPVRTGLRAVDWIVTSYSHLPGGSH